jgi:hypothetical protein
VPVLSVGVVPPPVSSVVPSSVGAGVVVVVVVLVDVDVLVAPRPLDA